MTRLRAKYGAAEARAILSREAAETEKAADANSTPLGRENDDQKKRAASFLPALPAAGAAEWWDAALLSGGKSYGAEVLREKRHRLEHMAIGVDYGMAQLPADLLRCLAHHLSPRLSWTQPPAGG